MKTPTNKNKKNKKKLNLLVFGVLVKLIYRWRKITCKSMIHPNVNSLIAAQSIDQSFNTRNCGKACPLNCLPKAYEFFIAILASHWMQNAKDLFLVPSFPELFFYVTNSVQTHFKFFFLFQTNNIWPTLNVIWICHLLFCQT